MAGCSDKALRTLLLSGQIERVRRGVYKWSAVPASFEQSVLAACLATSGAVACGVTAMALLGYLPARHRWGRAVHVVTLQGREQPVAAGVRVHRTRSLAGHERRKLSGVPVTSPARTLKDVAGVLTYPELEEFIGHLLATRAVTLSELERVETELRAPFGGGRKGAARLRSCLAAVGAGRPVESVLEHRVLVLLRRAQLPEPSTQVSIHDHSGRFVARVDFAYPTKRVAIEVDGYRWHSAPSAFRSDRLRDNRLDDLGWRVYRVTERDVREGLPELIGQLRRRLRRDATESPVAS